MKKIILFISLLCINFNCYTQELKFPVDNKTNEIIYSEVVAMDSIDKDQLFDKTRLWFVSTFVSYKNVCQLEDKSTGVIIVKPIFDVFSYAVGKTKVGIVEYTLKIQVKDNKYKYEIYNIRHKDNSLKTPGNLLLPKPSENEDIIMFVSWDDIKKQSYIYFEKLILDLKNKIENKKSTDDW